MNGSRPRRVGVSANLSLTSVAAICCVSFVIRRSDSMSTSRSTHTARRFKSGGRHRCHASVSRLNVSPEWGERTVDRCGLASVWSSLEPSTAPKSGPLARVDLSRRESELWTNYWSASRRTRSGGQLERMSRTLSPYCVTMPWAPPASGRSSNPIRQPSTRSTATPVTRLWSSRTTQEPWSQRCNSHFCTAWPAAVQPGYRLRGCALVGSVRGTGLGTALFEWAHGFGAEHGAILAQLTTDKVRKDAHRFYEQLGYRASHVGMKRRLGND